MKRQMLYTLVIILGLVLTVNLLRTLYRTYRSGQRVVALRQEVSELKVEEEQLKQQLEYRQSDAFVEREARDKLNLIKPGEKLLILDSGKGGLADGQVLASQQDDNNLANYQKWLRLFFN